MTAGMAAVYTTLNAIRPVDRSPCCPSTTPNGEPDPFSARHRCLFDPGHESTHRCRDCKHTWEDA